ncbi:MAG: hypothetical protein JXQ67_01620 [Campylobacterales bacterium]|nr:hypothetical protein [Campylobacterales bacterium]
MQRKQVLEILEKLKSIQIKKMQLVEDAIHAKGVSEPTPTDEGECEFGLLIHKHEKLLHELLGVQFEETLLADHALWHKEYEKFDAIFFHNKKAGFLLKLVGRYFGKYGINAEEFKAAQMYHDKLAEITGELLYYLDASIHRIKALPEPKFKA